MAFSRRFRTNGGGEAAEREERRGGAAAADDSRRSSLAEQARDAGGDRRPHGGPVFGAPRPSASVNANTATRAPPRAHEIPNASVADLPWARAPMYVAVMSMDLAGDTHHRLAELRLLVGAIQLDDVILHELLLDAVQAPHGDEAQGDPEGRRRASLGAENRAHGRPAVDAPRREADGLRRRRRRDEAPRGDVAERPMAFSESAAKMAAVVICCAPAQRMLSRPFWSVLVTPYLSRFSLGLT